MQHQPVFKLHLVWLPVEPPLSLLHRKWTFLGPTHSCARLNIVHPSSSAAVFVQ